MDKQKLESIAIIPARGGSKSLPRKNIIPLAGKPLIHYTIKVAQKSGHLDRIAVSTEDSQIADIARSCGAEVIKRPEELARDDTPSLSVLQHAIQYLEEKQNYHPQVIVILQPTSPLRTAEDINMTVEKFLKSKCDSVVSVCEIEHPLVWMYTVEGDRLKPVIEGEEKVIRRQDVPKVYRLNGAVYVVHRDTIMEENRLLGKDIRAYIMPSERSVDIDSEIDLKLAELLMEARR